MNNEIIFIPSKAFFTRKTNQVSLSKNYYSKICVCGREFESKNKGIELCLPCKNDKKGLYTANFTKIKPQIMQRDGFQCQCCHTNKKLIVHHIDGNRGNNFEQNLITLCNQCHNSLHSKYKENLFVTTDIRSLFPKSIEQGLYGVRLRYSN